MVIVLPIECYLFSNFSLQTTCIQNIQNIDSKVCLEIMLVSLFTEQYSCEALMTINATVPNYYICRAHKNRKGDTFQSTKMYSKTLRLKILCNILNSNHFRFHLRLIHVHAHIMTNAPNNRDWPSPANLS